MFWALDEKDAVLLSMFLHDIFAGYYQESFRIFPHLSRYALQSYHQRHFTYYTTFQTEMQDYLKKQHLALLRRFLL